MPDPEVIIGVDFGTTNSVAAVCLPDGVEVLTNDIDSRKTPSCVYLKDAEREVGEAALRMALSYPQNTIRNVKSVLGVTKDILGDRTPLGAVRIDSNCSSFDPISVKISKKKLLLSEEIAAMILLELKKSAEKQLSGKATKAVLAVPSYFSAAQRQAVIDAAYLAGLHVTTLVNETTAAALAYAHDREGRKTVVMVDVGGGGCSMSVVRVECNKVSVLAHSGPRLPGGEDFDSKMVAFLKQRVKESHGKEIVDPRDTEILRSHWSKAKEKLSRIPQVPMKVFLPGIEQEIELNLKRTDFQEQCRELFKEVTNGLARTLPVVRADEVAEVLLVGGCTRIPHLRDLIGKELDKPLSKAINPDEAVAVGAALLAAGCVEVTQEVLSLNTEVTIDDKPRILPRNMVLPLRHESRGSNSIEVEQEIIMGQMSSTALFRRKGIKVAEITVSGLLRVYGKDSEMKFILSGCHSPDDLSRQLKIIENYKQTEVAEIKRIEAKNALEKLLRVERGRPASVGDCFYEEIMRLRNECEERLMWLADHSGEPAKRFTEVYKEVEKQVDALRVKQELEKERIKARDRLRQTLEDLMREDIPEDPFREQATKLKLICMDLLNKIEKNKLTLTKEFNTELESVKSKRGSLEDDRKRHALLQRNRQAKESFERCVSESVLAWKKFSDETDDSIFRPYDLKFRTLSREAKKWLEAQGDTIDEFIFSQRLKSYHQNLSDLENKLKSEKEEHEKQRVEARDHLRDTLVVILGQDIPEDEFHGRASKLKRYCADVLNKLDENGLISTWDLKTKLESVEAKRASLENDREQHAVLQRTQQAKTSFEEGVIASVLTWKRFRGQTDPDIYRPHGVKFSALHSEALEWLEAHKDTTDESIFRQQLKSFQQQLSTIENGLNKEVASAEERRKYSFRAAEEKVNEALAIKVPMDDDYLLDLARKHQEHWKYWAQWLRDNPSVSHEQYDSLARNVDEQMDELRRASAQQEERMRLMTTINDLSLNGLEEFKGDVLFAQLTSQCLTWLASKPSCTNTDLGRYRARVSGVIDKLRTAQRHRLNLEQAATAAKAAGTEAHEDIGKLLLDFGFIEPSVAQNQPTTSPDFYDPKNFTQAVAVEDMDVDEDPVGSRASLPEITTPNIGAALDSKDILTLWENLHQPSPIMLNSDEHKVMLECLCEQLAVEALVGACSAACMALLMDREVTSDHEWVSLSLRFVVDTGDAVERLILVQDARDFNGPPRDFSSYLFGQFKSLCQKAKMNFRYPLKFLSAVDCGHFGPHFLELVRKETILVEEVGSISVPLDRRVANACYETPAVSDRMKDYIATFFSIIDVLREHFAMSGQRFKLLRCACDYVDDRDPWLTYTSSIKFLLDKRAKLPALLQQSVGLDPKQKWIMASVLEKLNEPLFTTCLVTFDGVFSELQGDSDEEANSFSGWKSILRRLEGQEHVLSSPTFQECLIDRIKACRCDFYLPEENDARNLIRLIMDVVTTVVSQMLTSYRDCCRLLECLESVEDRSRGMFDLNKYDFYQELLSLRKLFPQCSMDSPQLVLKKLPRFELLQTRPALYRAAKRVLTVPLIPPVGPRSAAQLRDGVRRTAAILPTMGTAVVPVAVWACRPSEDALARALIDVQKRCPQLASSRPGLMVTKL